jgi:hypothetical protein
MTTQASEVAPVLNEAADKSDDISENDGNIAILNRIMKTSRH